MNVAYLKVTCGRCFHLISFFSRRPTADVRRWGGIVVHQLWSSALSGKHEVWAPGAGMARHVFFVCFLATGMVAYLYIWQFISMNNANIYVMIRLRHDVGSHVALSNPGLISKEM